MAPADNPFEPLVVRGHVVDWIGGDAAWTIIDRVVAKYGDVPYPRVHERVVAVIAVHEQVVGAMTTEHKDKDQATPRPEARVRRFDHVGITVADFDTAARFFVDLGLEADGRMVLDGPFLDTVTGIANAKTEIVMLRPPDGGTTLELSEFHSPRHHPGSPAPMANELGIRNVAFEVEDLNRTMDRLALSGYVTIGGIGQHERSWRMAYVRGPEGIIVSLAERIG